jgi:L-lactate dehydrogenase complex protein LldG
VSAGPGSPRPDEGRPAERPAVGTARALFLARIRAEMGKTPGLFSATAATRPTKPERLAEAFQRELAERWPEALERFRREFERVGGRFHRVATGAEVAAVVGQVAREGRARRVVTWHPVALGVDLTAGLAAEALDVEVMPEGVPGDADTRHRLRERIAAAELGLTGADVVIAETGTLVLVSGAGRPRSTALLPPCHLAVFDRTALVESLAQMGVILEAWHAGSLPTGRGTAIHFITGPSRTADIELTLTRGVHGPGDVHAIFVDAPLRG